MFISVLAFPRVCIQLCHRETNAYDKRILAFRPVDTAA
jgi:hypothetical protein